MGWLFHTVCVALVIVLVVVLAFALRSIVRCSGTDGVLVRGMWTLECVRRQ